jgi:hypothetical protein
MQLLSRCSETENSNRSEYHTKTFMTTFNVTSNVFRVEGRKTVFCVAWLLTIWCVFHSFCTLCLFYVSVSALFHYWGSFRDTLRSLYLYFRLSSRSSCHSVSFTCIHSRTDSRERTTQLMPSLLILVCIFAAFFVSTFFDRLLLPRKLER